MKKGKLKKLMAGLISALMILTLMPAAVFAEDTEGRFETDDGTVYFYQDVKDSMPNAQEGYTYEFKYELDQADHTATLVTANSVNSAHYADADLTVLGNITYNGESYTVTTIGENAFEHSQVKSIHLPDTITAIEANAFIYCYDVEELNIPSGVTSIGENAFWSCQSLKKIVIPEGVTVIPDGAFSQCWSADYLAIPDGVTSIGEDAFQEFGLHTDVTQTLTIPSSVTEIGGQAFRLCNTLTSVVFEEGGTESLTIDTGFWGCENLESVVFPSNLTAFTGVNGTFHNCPKLTSVILPVGMEEIGESSFLGCSALKEIVVPYTVTTIGFLCFMDVDQDSGSGIYAMDKVVYYPETAQIPDGGFYYVTQAVYSVNEDGTATITEVIGDEIDCLPGILSGLMVSDVPDAYTAPDKHTHYFGIDHSEVYCTICGTLDPDHVHEWDPDYTVDKEPTCTAEGSESIHCQSCNEVKDERAIPAKGHTPGTEWKSDADTHWKKCTVCGEKVNEAAHTFEWVTDKEASGAMAGSRHEKCTVCGYAKAAVEIPASGTDSGSVSTGDYNTFGIWITMLVIAGAGVTGVAIYRRKSNTVK